MISNRDNKINNSQQELVCDTPCIVHVFLPEKPVLLSVLGCLAFALIMLVSTYLDVDVGLDINTDTQSGA